MVGVKLSKAMRDVVEERARQKDKGFTSEHDDYYEGEELARAASCYLMARDISVSKAGVPFEWPWHAQRWKPHTRRHNLVKAGALILAEIERLDRVASSLREVDQ
ncbi:hypothetical protein APX81_06730 [Escherichia coli]|nr:hypothetical protein [Escherichia coli]EAC1404453.1 hypothetical protein [Escherichia coli]EEW6031789.1 hypothetical protein [Escherichia coli]EFC4873347.1 hypothetical protein [Escherichia coli]EFN9261317.1 hypothetical protein [Escherichia coli]EGK3604418.1 hypothetical protein [Escherichia coli]